MHLNISKERLEKSNLFDHELEYKEVNYNSQRLIVCLNAEPAELERIHRDDEVRRLREKIKGKSVQQLISNPSHKRFLKIDDDKKLFKFNEEKNKEDAI